VDGGAVLREKELRSGGGSRGGSRGGGWRRDETAVAGGGSRGGTRGGGRRLAWWQEARVVAGGSRGRRNLQRRNGSCAREEEGVLFLSPNQTIWPRFPNTRGLSPLFGTGFLRPEA